MGYLIFACHFRFCERAVRLVGLLRKETGNFRHPMHFSLPVHLVAHSLERTCIFSQKSPKKIVHPAALFSKRVQAMQGEISQNSALLYNRYTYGFDTSSRLPKISGLFCKNTAQEQGSLSRQQI